MKGDLCVIKILKADAGVSALAAVYPYIAPEEYTNPFIVVVLDNSENSHTKSGVSILDVDTVTCNIVSTSLATTVNINEAVRTALDYYSGDLVFSSETISIDRVWLDSTSSYLEKETSRTYYIIEATYKLRIRR